jgi:acetoin:2,6-dichlorophenolindophenol oxidoreductase subunit alpha
VNGGELLALVRHMVTIRLFEDRAEKLHTDGLIGGPFHSSAGQEAVAVGVCAALREDDVITSTHRGHGHLIAKGARLAPMCAELAGAREGYCGGLGGSMHIADMSIGAIGENGIVGGSVFLATGAALGFQLDGTDRVAVAFFGDGGLGQGVLFECLTLAGLWNLPLLLVCEDNAYAHSFPSRRLPLSERGADWWSAFGVAGVRCDGNDVTRVHEQAVAAVQRARSGGGTTFLHTDCYRWRGHNLNDAHLLYRSREEVAAAREADPVDVALQLLREAGAPVERAELEREAEAELDEAWESVAPVERPGASAVFAGVPG